MVAKAIENPSRYVIKPQKEGGGNNFYGEAVKTMLTKISTSPEALADIRQYLIMERISPPEIPACMLKKGKIAVSQATLQELGIYSSLFIDVSGPTLVRELQTFGKLVRTKNADTDEGGVATGYSVVDQPYLTQEIGPLTPTLRVKPLIKL